ncbi:MAG: hypothetical protein AAB858_01165 [Patescibacteria group bacterium]
MQKLNGKKVGLVLGSFAAAVHAIWAAIVGLGWGQAYLDFIFQSHFIINQRLVSGFDWPTAIWLIAMAFAVAYVAGFALASIWNYFQKTNG